MHGPLGFCDLDSQGLLVDGFDEMSSIITYYHNPYYKEHLEKLGYAKDVDWLEFEILLPENEQIERIDKLAIRSLEKNNLRIVELKNKKKNMQMIYLTS